MVTETGMLQLWCVAKDGRRWKLEFNVRERVTRMNIGIDLGTTNSALAYIDPAEAEDADFPPIHILPIPQHVRKDAIEPQRTLPSFLYLGDDQIVHGRLCARAGRAGPDQDRALGEIVAVESGRRPHGEDPAVGRAGSRTRAVASRSFRAIPEALSAKPGKHAKANRLTTQHVVLTVPASFDEEARELTVQAAKEAGIENLTLHRRACGGVLFLDRQPPRAIAEESVRRPDRAGLRCRRRHQRLHSDPSERAKAIASSSRAPPSASTCCWAATISI